MTTKPDMKKSQTTGIIAKMFAKAFAEDPVMEHLAHPGVTNQELARLLVSTLRTTQRNELALLRIEEHLREK